MVNFRKLLCVMLLVAGSPAEAQRISLPMKKGSVQFAVIGDSGTGSKLQYDTASELAQVHQEFPFSFVLMLGDNLYGHKKPKDFREKFEVPYQTLLKDDVKFYASLGNHDVPQEQFYEPFHMNGHRYYSFRKGNVQFFALDSDYMDPDQLKWLTGELRVPTQDWRIAFFHHPLYSSAEAHGSSIELRAVLEPLFEEGGVQVVFSGHDHVYERISPQHGISYFTEGSSGQIRLGDVRGALFTSKSFDQDCTFMIVEVSGDQLFFQTISRTGKTVDSGMISRSGTANARNSLRNHQH